MIKTLFNVIIKKPKTILFFVFLITFVSIFFIFKLSIDASSETLLLDDDKDLKFSRQVNQTFENPDFLVVTYKPKSDLLSQESLNNMQELSDELKKVDMVKSTLSILNAPLLESPPVPIKELVKKVPTLMSAKVDKKLAKEEFLTSPLYKNNLVSKDFKTTAIVVNLKEDTKYLTLLNKRNKLLQKDKNGSLTQNEKEKLALAENEFKRYRDTKRAQNHQQIEQIRSIISKYKKDADLFLGGVNMIADDMVTYVKNDILIYGSALFVLLVITLWSFFGQRRFVLLPLLICTISVIITTGILGFLGLEITVISSNFISLQLIITLSITLHLIVQYQEYVLKFSKSSQKRILLGTLLAKANPSFFAIITTIAGFSSLIFSQIKPIINLGFMMSIGIFISLIVSFVVFGSVGALQEKKSPKPKLNKRFSITKISAHVVKKYNSWIVIVSTIVLIIGVYGASKLKVENSFINYFKSSTEIYKGMKVIDQELGGTTPLDVILTFKINKTQIDKNSELSEFEEEFASTSQDEQYWFTRPKVELIKKVHEYLKSLDEIGNVQSFGTLLKTGKNLNDGKNLDSFELALLYNELPEKYKNIILKPFINIDKNQARFVARIIDSNPDLRRDAFLKKINNDLEKIVPKDIATFRLSNLMVLYNNMLQSLFRSQIVTLGFVVLVLTLMFVVLFRSLKIALIAIVSNLIPMSFLFGFMGLSGIPLDMMSITIAAISVGIGVDDTIHYIHRFKTELMHTKDYIKAMENSHNTIGYAMFYTSFAIILGFSVLVVSNFIPTIYFGLLTVLVMAMVLLGALFLLPYLLIYFKPIKISKTF